MTSNINIMFDCSIRHGTAYQLDSSTNKNTRQCTDSTVRSTKYTTFRLTQHMVRFECLTRHGTAYQLNRSTDKVHYNVPTTVRTDIVNIVSARMFDSPWYNVPAQQVDRHGTTYRLDCSTRQETQQRTDSTAKATRRKTETT